MRKSQKNKCDISLRVALVLPSSQERDLCLVLKKSRKYTKFTNSEYPRFINFYGKANTNLMVSSQGKMIGHFLFTHSNITKQHYIIKLPTFWGTDVLVEMNQLFSPV